MKNKHLVLLFLFFRGIIFSNDLSEIVIPLVESMMKNRNIPTLQIVIFNPQKIWLQQFEYDLQEQQTKRNENLYNYFVGELSYPLVAYYFKKEYPNMQTRTHFIIESIERNLKKSNFRIKKYKIQTQEYLDLKKENSKSLTISSLLNMTSGLEISKSGISVPNQNPDEKMEIRSFPYENFFLSTKNYLVLYDSIASSSPEHLISSFYKNIFFYKGRISKEFLKNYKIPFGSFSGKKIKYITDFEIHNAFSFGLITNVKNYTELINKIYKENLIFDSFYTNSNNTTGFKNGFFYRKSCDGQFYIAESFGFLPGYSSYFLIMENGYGFGIFQSSDDEFTLHYIRDKIEELFYTILEINCFQETLQQNNLKHILGYYRGENIIENSFLKTFFTDFWLRVDSQNRFEVSHFFSKDPLGYLELKNQLLFFKGYSKINRYPIYFIEENKKIKKISFGIYEYKKICWYESIRGIIILILIVILVFFLFFLGVIIYAKC